jgi:hypothetical protein
MTALGQALLEGVGAVKNHEEALDWLRKAAAAGSSEAAELLQSLEDRKPNRPVVRPVRPDEEEKPPTPTTPESASTTTLLRPSMTEEFSGFPLFLAGSLCVGGACWNFRDLIHPGRLGEIALGLCVGLVILSYAGGDRKRWSFGHRVGDSCLQVGLVAGNLAIGRIFYEALYWPGIVAGALAALVLIGESENDKDRQIRGSMNNAFANFGGASFVTAVGIMVVWGAVWVWDWFK